MTRGGATPSPASPGRVLIPWGFCASEWCKPLLVCQRRAGGATRARHAARPRLRAPSTDPAHDVLGVIGDDEIGALLDVEQRLTHGLLPVGRVHLVRAPLAQSTPAFGDRRTYKMDSPNGDE